MVQTFATLAIVLAAAGYLLSRWLRRDRLKSGGCGAGCGCAAAKHRANERLGVRRELVQLSGNMKQEPGSGKA